MTDLEIPSIGEKPPDRLVEALTKMVAVYQDDPMKAVRSQEFIKILHTYLASELESRLSQFAKSRGIKVKLEGKVLGSHKPKDVDVSVLDPDNGPLMLIGVRSQMSSVGKNALNYYEGIIGECISLQDRFPMATHGYVYLMPKVSIKEGRESETIDHTRFSRLYAAISGRRGIEYSKVRGVFDEFAYMVVDFDSSPPKLDRELVADASPEIDLSISTFVDRMIATFSKRMLFWNVFDSGPSGDGPLT